MPFSGIVDDSLPDDIKSMSRKKREVFVGAFNSAYDRYSRDKDQREDPSKSLDQNKESFAFRVARAAIKKLSEAAELMERYTEEQLQSVILTESNFHFLEASSKDGSEWEIIAIEEGASKNPPPSNFFYTADVLKKAVPLIENSKVFAYQFKGAFTDLLDHLPDTVRTAMPKGLSQNVVGFLKNPRFGEFDRGSGAKKKGILATFVVTANWLKEALSNAWKHGKKNLFGFSIDGEGPAELRHHEGMIMPFVKEIKKFNELTLVTKGAAATGRQFLRLVASDMTVNELKELLMKDKIIKQLQERAPHLLEGKKIEDLTEEQVMELLAEAMKPKEKEKGKEPPKEIKKESNEFTDEQQVTKLLEEGNLEAAHDFLDKLRKKKDKKKESDDQDSVLAAAKDLIKPIIDRFDKMEAATIKKEAALSLDAKLAESKLPEVAKTKLKESFSGRDYNGEDISKEIKLEQDYHAKLSESGRVSLDINDQCRIKVDAEELDRYRLAMDGLFESENQKDKNGKKVGAFRNLKEAYKYIVGDPWADANAITILQESFYFVPQMPDSPGFAPSYDYRRRMALRESFRNVHFQESLTVSSFGEILGDSITRRMQKKASLDDKNIWREIVSDITSVNDFRTQRRMVVGGYGTLSTVAQGVTYPPLTSPTDAEETYSISKKGGLEDLTMEMVADDDVGALRMIPDGLARASVETLYRGVFDLLTANATMGEDSIALFDSGTHGNTGTTALADAELQVVRGLMRSQSAYNNTSEILGEANAPRILVIPNELEQTAWELNASPFVVTSNKDATVPNINKQKYVVQPVVIDYYTDADNWFAIADPKKQRTIEVGFFQGRQEPELFCSTNRRSRFTPRLRNG